MRERYLPISSRYIYGLIKERRNSSALAMTLRLSCTNQSISVVVSLDCWNHYHVIWDVKYIRSNSQICFNNVQLKYAQFCMLTSIPADSPEIVQLPFLFGTTFEVRSREIYRGISRMYTHLDTDSLSLQDTPCTLTSVYDQGSPKVVNRNQHTGHVELHPGWSRYCLGNVIIYVIEFSRQISKQWRVLSMRKNHT